MAGVNRACAGADGAAAARRSCYSDHVPAWRTNSPTGLAKLAAQDALWLEPTSALGVAHQIEAPTLVKRLSGDTDVVAGVLRDVNMAPASATTSRRFISAG